jgi:hypothetical protein
MSNENIVCSHELVVRFDQFEDGTVSWIVQAYPDSRAVEGELAGDADNVVAIH